MIILENGAPELSQYETRRYAITTTMCTHMTFWRAGGAGATMPVIETDNGYKARIPDNLIANYGYIEASATVDDGNGSADVVDTGRFYVRENAIPENYAPDDYESPVYQGLYALIRSMQSRMDAGEFIGETGPVGPQGDPAPADLVVPAVNAYIAEYLRLHPEATIDEDIIRSAVNAWLANHPEYVTTVMDNSISAAKLTAAVRENVEAVPGLKQDLGDLIVTDDDDITDKTMLAVETDGDEIEIPTMQDIEDMFDRSFIDKCVVLNGKGVSTTTNAIIDDSNYKLILIPKALRLQLAGIVAPNMYPVKMLMLSDSLSYVNRNTTVYFANNNLRADNYEYLAISYPIDSEIDIQPLSYQDFTEGIKPDAARNTYRRSSNMLNNRMLSKLGSSTSAFSYDANRNCTNLFSATYGDVIYTQDMTTGTYMTMLDSSFNVLGRLNTSPYERNKYKYEVTRPNTAYVFFWCSKDDVDFSGDGIYFVKNNQNAFYEPYYVANNIPINLEEQKIKSYNVETRYLGTVWSGLGDSLTADGSGGLYRNYVWNYFGLSDYVNCGIGGTRMSGNIANAMWQDSRINSLSLDSRVVTIMAGTNDAPYVSVSEEEFTRDNHDINSFVGAYNVCISKILYKFLNIEGFYSDIDYSGITRVSDFVDVSKFRLVLITPPKMFGSENYLNKSELFAEYVKRIAKMWGLPCVDANSEMEMNSINKSLYWTHQTTPDWTHFNEKAHYNLAELIIAKAKEVEPLQ